MAMAFKPYHKRIKPDEPRRPVRDAYDKTTLVVGVIGVIVVGASTVITAYQATMTRKDLENSIDQNRAWIKLTVVPREGITVGRDNIGVGYDVVATNVGTIPATNLDFSSEIEVRGPLTTEKYVHACDVRKRHPVVGVTLFPGETARRWIASAISTNGHIDETSRYIGLNIYACAQYRFGHSEHDHRTAEKFSLSNGYEPLISLPEGLQHSVEIELADLKAERVVSGQITD
jgi:hypothetical protein